MRSKTSYFNSTLFKKNLIRFWPLWGGASLIGALVPLTMLMELIQHGFGSIDVQPLEMTQAYYFALQIGIPIISLFYAVLCALAVWHYLYNPRSVGFYHALPATRKGLFVTNLLSGMAMMLIPYAVTGGLAVCISIAAGFFEPAGVLVTILGVLGLSLFYFATATLIAFITGNPFAFAAFYFIFHFLAMAAEWLASELMTRFYFGVYKAYEGVAAFLSPTVFFADALNVHVDYVETVTPDGWIDYDEIASVTLAGGWLIAVYALVGIVFLGCAWLLYQRRRSESAGDVVAVGWMKPVFRYGVAICAALSGGVLLYSLLWEGFQKRSTADIAPMAVCMALAGLIGYYIASMLLAKSVKIFRGSGKGALATVIAAAAICAVIGLDPVGVEALVPELEDVDSVSLYISGPYGRGCTADLETPEDIQKVLDLHSAAVAERDSLDLHSTRYAYAPGETVYANVTLTYYRSGGRTVHRSYGFNYSPETLSQGGAVTRLAELACDPAVQESNIFGDLSGENITDVRLTGGYISGLYDNEMENTAGLDLTLEQAKIVEDGIRRDIQAGHFGRTAFLADYDDYHNAACSGEIQLYYTYTRKPTEYYHGGTSTSSTFLSISTYCTETLKALEEAGVLTDIRTMMTQAEYDRQFNRGEDLYYEDPYGYESASVVYPEDAIMYAEEVH